MTAQLRMLDRADRDVMKLTRADIGAVYEFMHKFRHNPDSPGLRLKQLSGESRLWSARVNQDYRALLLHVQAREYLLVAVRHRREVYEDLDRYAYRINRITGGIEVIDLEPVGDSIIGRVVPPEPEPPAALFAHVTAAQLVELGVAEPLLPQIRTLTDPDQLLELLDRAPQLTTDVLFALYDGRSVDDVREHITAPVRADDPVDPTDFAAALARPATQVSSDDEALQAMLGETFQRWQVFLHPTQRSLVERTFNGPARVGGGPGTGKTIVALHRVAHLAHQLPAGTDKPILLTTFNRNLAADLRTRLLALGGQELLARVDIVNIDALASRVVREAKAADAKRIVDDTRMVELWQQYLTEYGETEWTADFLAAEWNEVILGQVLTSRSEYFRARRPGRGRPVAREARNRIWQLTEGFIRRVDEQNVASWRQIASHAARLEIDRAVRATESGSGYRYRHVVVDEAQDLSAAHWKMLRAMVAPGRNDLFLVGDTHQRLYETRVTLGSLGINIRGRSARLTLSYRTTREILAAALEIMTGETYDDLDGGDDTLAGYRSLLRGAHPRFSGVETWAAERDLVVAQLRAWDTPEDGSTAVCVPTRELAEEIRDRLAADGITAVELGPDGPRQPDGVHVGTMHRLKGLEYKRIIIAAATDGLIPRRGIARLADRDPGRYQRERQRDRSLLFVAATRARDELAISWHGDPSPFLPSQRPAG